MAFVSTGIDADGNATGYDSDSGIISFPDQPDPRQATLQEVGGYNQFFNSPDYVSGSRVAAEQAAADKGGSYGLGSLLGLAALAFGVPAGLEYLGGLGGFGAEAGIGSSLFEGMGSAGMMSFPEAAGTGAIFNSGPLAQSIIPGAFDLGAYGGAAAGGALANNAFNNDIIENSGNFTGGNTTAPTGSPNDIIENAGNFTGGGGGGSSGVPIEELSRTFNPATSGGMPDLGNLAATAFRGIGIPGFSNAAGSAAGGMPWNLISGGMNIGSGIYGWLQKKKLQDMASQAFSNYQNMGDPYARAKALSSNPGSITSMPGYQFGMDEGRRAIQRVGAAGGSGGNEAIALARYTPEYAQNFYNNEMARLMQLGQGEAQFGANSGQLGIQAQTGANSLASSSLASMGYGATRIAGMPQPSSNDMLYRMLASAFR